MITITGRLIGMTKPLFADWLIAVESYLDGNDDWTVRELIEMIIREEFDAFERAPYERDFLRAVNADRITIATTAFKDTDSKETDSKETDTGDPNLDDLEIAEPITLATGSPRQDVDVESAIENTWRAFDEEIFIFLLDEDEKFDLDESIHVRADSRVTIVRVVPLGS